MTLKQELTCLFNSLKLTVASSTKLLFICLIIVVAAAFPIGALQQLFLNSYSLKPGFEDHLFWFFASHWGIPFAWCIAPTMMMLWLFKSGAFRRSDTWASRHPSCDLLWGEDVVDVIFGALVFSLATLCGACAAAAFFANGTTDFSANGVFALVVGAPLEGTPPSTVSVIVACWLLSFCVLLLFGTLFQLGRRLLRNPYLPFVLLIAIGLPQIHGPQAGIYEIAQVFGLPLDTTMIYNPLSIPFEFASVFYPSWIPGSDHGFWVPLLIAALFIALGVLVARKQSPIDLRKRD